MTSYKEWIDEIDINVDYYSAFLVVLQIKRATDLQIILAINRLLWTFLSHCNETVLHIAGIRNPPMQINCTGGFPDKTIKTVARLF